EHADHHREQQRRDRAPLGGRRGEGGGGEAGDPREAGLRQAELPGDEHRVEREREDAVESDEDESRLGEQHQTSRTLRLPNRPSGRTSRMTNSSANAIRSRQLEPMYWMANTSAMPRMSPPTSEPDSDPMPPTMITARPFS